MSIPWPVLTAEQWKELATADPARREQLLAPFYEQVFKKQPIADKNGPTPHDKAHP